MGNDERNWYLFQIGWTINPWNTATAATAAAPPGLACSPVLAATASSTTPRNAKRLTGPSTRKSAKRSADAKSTMNTLKKRHWIKNQNGRPTVNRNTLGLDMGVMPKELAWPAVGTLPAVLRHCLVTGRTAGAPRVTGKVALATEIDAVVVGMVRMVNSVKEVAAAAAVEVAEVRHEALFWYLALPIH